MQFEWFCTKFCNNLLNRIAAAHTVDARMHAHIHKDDNINDATAHYTLHLTQCFHFARRDTESEPTRRKEARARERMLTADLYG